MRKTLVAAIFVLTACEQRAASDEVAESVAILDEFGNQTTGGFPADRYRIEDCHTEIPLQAPFRASEDGWGGLAIRVPLRLLDNPAETRTAPEGPSHQDRLAFYDLNRRGAGLREEIIGRTVPGTSVEVFRQLASQRAGLDGLYVGELAPGRQGAIQCLGHGLPNPWCEAEAEVASGMRYRAKFPQHVAHRLHEILAIGDRLFADVVSRCASASTD